MKIHSNDFKEQIKLMGKQIDSQIIVDEMVLGADELNTVTPSFQTSLLKSVMKQLDVDSNVEIPLNSILNYQFGVKINGEYEYIDFGDYVVYKVEKQEDLRSYKILCYDKMLYTMKPYTTLQNGTFPMTVRDYIKNLCLDCGLVFKNANDVFANYDKIIESDIYADLGYTYRDIFDELAQVTASNICLDVNNQVEVRYITETNDVIDEEYLKDTNVNFGEKFGKVNSIVLSRSAESDNVYLRDEESVATNGLCEIKIVENQIMNFDNRSDFLPDILEKLNGLEFFINDFVSTGVCYYDVCDKYGVQIGDNVYPCVMFDDEILVTQGLQENIFTERPKESQTDYTKADKTDRKLNRTTLIVDKQQQTIESTVATVEDLNENYTQLQQTSDSLSITVGNNVADVESLKQQTSNNNTAINTMQGTITEMSFNFQTDGLRIGKIGDDVNSTLDNAGLKIFNISKLIAIFNKNGSGIKKLIVTDSIQFQNLLLKKGRTETKRHGTIDVIQGFWLDNLIETLEDLEV